MKDDRLAEESLRGSTTTAANSDDDNGNNGDGDGDDGGGDAADGGSQVPQAELLGLLEASGISGDDGRAAAPQAEDSGAADASTVETISGTDDCSITPTAVDGVWLAQTTDFFYPLVDDPYTMGKVACANVLSDLYAVGVARCDTMLMLLGVSTQLADPDVRRTATALCMRGFRDLAMQAGTRVTGGQTVRNPWFVVGGVASAVVAESQMIRPVHAQPGDVLVLTKPLGTQPTVVAYGYLADKAKMARLDGIVSRQQLIHCYDQAVASMARLNQTGAELMHRYDAHAATDVTGFGLIGHAQNLAAGQTCGVDFVIHTLPVLPHALALDTITGFGLLEGRSPETSGGLLVALPAKQAPAFVAEISQRDGWPAFIVGDVIQGTGQARLAPEAQLRMPIVEVDLDAPM
ncbi:selenide [Thamnocephalis sphaerospora]|uniref:Selenide n=1 Tax=Thamnocephalis sphaerospora TaxID=78915 RepID=A0A4P9XSN0_9FUNG|nr:selenide [Thamnocephalis sphaerospora]|eukprot:RKP09158.1 selenide [Thamnocephalis sphaerospora]